MLKTTRALLLIFAAGSGPTGLDAHAAEPHREKAKPAFTLGKETTYFTGPLDRDGYVDYETALNERLSRGIKPENNANVLLWKALNPHPEGAAMPAEFFRWLNVRAPPERGEYFIDIARYAKENLKLAPRESKELFEQRDRAAQRPWLTRDYPRIARWLKANEKPLAVVIEASKRPDYYNPLVSRKSGQEGWYGLLGALLPGVAKCREVAVALAARAMLHAGETRFDEAWQDGLACHRLGRLLARGADHSEFVGGVAISQLASDATLALLDRANPTAQQARSWLRDLERLPPNSLIADKIERGGAPGRLAFLNTVMFVRRRPVQALRFIELLGSGRRLPPGAVDPEVPQAIVDALDWDAILRSGNVWYDRVVAALRIKDRASREKELDRLEAELKARKKDAGSPADLIHALQRGGHSGKELSKKLADILIDFLWPAIRQLQKAADRSEQARRNLHLALRAANRLR